MSTQLYEFITRHGPGIENTLQESLPLSSLPGTELLNQAVRDAVFPAGRRLRPILATLASMIAGLSEDQRLPIACAMEFLHSSSLILDDLPCMDDSDLRRGRAALHMVFGEGLAILAAVALLNQSYSLLVRAARGEGCPGAAEILISAAARCVGTEGMIGGQVIDLQLQRTGSNQRDTWATRDLKTTALMRLTLTAGALVHGADASDIAALAHFGDCLGKAYQICDDLQDVAETTEQAGNSAKPGARHFRSAIPSQSDVENARAMAVNLVGQAKETILERFGHKRETHLLADTADLAIHFSACSKDESAAELKTRRSS